MPVAIRSVSLNKKWIEENLYKNIIELEKNHTIIREGCETIEQYNMIPPANREMEIAERRFKALRFYLTILENLFIDLSPLLNEELTETKEILKLDDHLKRIRNILNDKNLFIKYKTDKDNRITAVIITKLFNETADILFNTREELYKKITGILYIKDGSKV